MNMIHQTLRCDTCAIKQRSMCGALTRPELERLSAMAHQRMLPPGQIIFRENEEAGYFANVISGVVKLTKSLGDGREQIVGLQFASDFLGRPYRSRSPYQAEAVTEVHLCTYEKLQFERLVHDYKDLEHRLFESTLDELDAAHEWMLLLGRKSAEEKVASFLMMVSRRTGNGGCDEHRAKQAARFDLPLTRTEIADFLGLTIETVSRQFSRLKVDKVIALDGSRSISILDAQRLRQVSEKNQ